MGKYEAEADFWSGESRDPSAHDFGRYPRHLMLDEYALRGMKVLDLGCGPIAYATAFRDCRIIGLDPLVGQYREMGYPLDGMEYVEGRAEDMPFSDGSFDAVISMNALDHVDDFERACSEIERVTRGFVRVEVHYHAPTVTEPQELDDVRVGLALPSCVKIREVLYSFFYPGTLGTVALWTSRQRSPRTAVTTATWTNVLRPALSMPTR